MKEYNKAKKEMGYTPEENLLNAEYSSFKEVISAKGNTQTIKQKLTLQQGGYQVHIEKEIKNTLPFD